MWLLLLCTAVQLYYAAYYFLPFARRPPEPTTSPAAAEPLSVLVCAHNELENLRRLLPLLLQQDYPAGFEIILIDDRSTDDTFLYVQQLTQYYPHVRLVTITNTPHGLSPKKYALTLGIKTARHACMLFTDADCIPATNQWLNHMQRGFRRPADVVLGYSAYVAEPGFLNQLVRFETLLTGAQYLSFAWRGRPYMGVGRNLAYTRQVFHQTKGFASHIRSLGGDDDLFVQDAVQQGARVAVVAEPGAHTLSEAAQTWGAWWRQKRRHLSAGKRYRWADRVRLGNFIGTNLLFYFTAVSLLFSQPDWIPLAVVWSVRTVAVTAVYYQLGRRLDERLPVAWLPILDVVYFFNYLALGISLFLYRTLRWK
ncbi:MULTISPECIES: glycosyltransferase [Hymenobacter]|uniref:Glycosyltransferase, catalytic subunit of cellulose synthase and poly-beta-1,6-N-acetylglucosamine synthase n=1 Tax=Hymenobacter mucosus TaxID=1411120 RepID=A0A238YDL2_9BACT|nr:MULTISPECIES: glycosyltransferase [Hymenobacter]SNR69052.1 Glycosyltransferase, catalytic subunit of cellulose synthase and poly-beta-1,6-N-acetylglucosamine synthase [Hymenobacter mucosus]